MKNKFKHAFTLIELLIVIAIIAILTVAFLPGALKAPAKARDAGRIKSVNDIASALESYAAEHNGTIPTPDGTNCLIKPAVPAAGDLSALSSYFPNDKFPEDQKPFVSSTVNGACNNSVNKNAYFYDTFGTNYYIVGTIVEVAASANTSKGLTTDFTSVNSDALWATLKGTILSSGGGTAPTILPAAVPYYVKVGP
ncbi:prepilin-type N-terminal cleavage/methylation domain-containing protein [Candidatus Peregrinibacteria bacterium]|nr:prepilin-type N-terminal cleavage/methylation domain-containing protein [Candidatus Peregrinibacteria bacterium]